MLLYVLLFLLLPSAVFAQGTVNARTQAGDGTPITDTTSGRLDVTVQSPVNAAQSGTWTVQPGNTANTTAWKVDGSAVTQPVSGTVAATVADGADVAQGAIADAAKTDSTLSGTVIAWLKGLVKIWADVWDSVNHRIKVDGSGVTQPVSGTVTVTDGAGALNVIVDSSTLPSGASTAAKQPALGTAGTASADVLTVQGITSMTPLKVDGSGVTQPVSLASVPSHAVTNAGTFATQATLQTGANVIGALTANQSVNVAQINGVTPLMGAGATGTGAQRTNPVSSSATGAAPPASGSFTVGLGSGATGGFLVGVPVADTFKSVSVTSATTTLLVTGVSGRHVRITSLNLVTATANNVALISGTGATCGTGTAGIAGGTTAANGWNFAANGGLTLGGGLGTVLQTAATGDSVCVITSAAGPLAGTLGYAIY